MRNKTGDTGLPWGMPVSTVVNSSLWPSNAILSCRSLRKLATHAIRLGGRASCFNIPSSWFFATWSNAPFTSKNRVKVSRLCFFYWLVFHLWEVVWYRLPISWVFHLVGYCLASKSHYLLISRAFRLVDYCLASLLSQLSSLVFGPWCVRSLFPSNSVMRLPGMLLVGCSRAFQVFVWLLRWPISSITDDSLSQTNRRIFA